MEDDLKHSRNWSCRAVVAGLTAYTKDIAAANFGGGSRRHSTVVAAGFFCTNIRVRKDPAPDVAALHRQNPRKLGLPEDGHTIYIWV